MELYRDIMQTFSKTRWQMIMQYKTPKFIDATVKLYKLACLQYIKLLDLVIHPVLLSL